jgi:hypothetical protein
MHTRAEWTPNLSTGETKICCRRNRSSLLLLSGGDLCLSGTLDAVSTALNFLLGFTGVLGLGDETGLNFW